MVANQRKPEPHPETFLSRANGKTFEAVRRLLGGTGQRPSISSSLLSHTEAGALGVPPSVISSVQDLARPLADVLNRGGKGWRGYALAVPFQACFPSKPAWSRGRLIVWSGPPDSISLELGRDALLGYHGDSPPRDGTGLIFLN